MKSINIQDMIEDELLLEGLANVRKRYLDTKIVDPKTFDLLVNTDPTPQGKYLDWVFKKIVNSFKNSEGIVHPSEELESFIESLKGVLSSFNDGVTRGLITKKDINQYRTITELIETTSDVANKKSKTEEKKNKKYEETTKVFEDDSYLIVIPRSWEASKRWGRGAKWCISYEGSIDYWEQYTYQKELVFYFVIDKQLDPRHYHTAKVALGVRDDNEIEEPFDASDNRLSYSQLEDFLEELENAGIHRDTFTHEPWEDIAEEDYERCIEIDKENFQREIDNYDFDHVEINMDNEYYYEGLEPINSFIFTPVLNIKIPNNATPLRKSLGNISDSAEDEIIEILSEFYDFGNIDYISDVISPESEYVLGITLYNEYKDASNLDDAVRDVSEVDDNYENILYRVLGVLAKDGILKDDGYYKYIKSFSKIYNTIYNEDEDGETYDKSIINMKHIKFDPDPSDFEIVINYEDFKIEVGMLENFEKNIRVHEGRTTKMFHLSHFKNASIFKAFVKSVMKTIKGEDNPNQLRLKEIDVEPILDFTDKELKDIENYMLNSRGTIMFLKETSHILRLYIVKMKPEHGIDLDLLVRALNILDKRYEIFNAILVEELNDALPKPTASLKYIGESFEMFVGYIKELISN